MARIKDASVEEVKRRADIADVVSLRTSLRKQGPRLVGRCPFHEERTPSFSVNPAKNVYYCFGCGAGGDVLRFVQETEGVDFVGAIEWLADRYGIALEYEEVSPAAEAARSRRERVYRLLDDTAGFFERLLWETERGAPVREYLEGRGIGEEVARAFRLGLSPGGGLAAKARERGFSVDELRLAGLVNQRGNDYFPRRLMFPLADARGRVVGFQARRLADDDPLRGKYVNSPESEYFHKGSILYGLHLARPAIAAQERAVVVEGNTDVLALRQAGFEAVVASMGTALTERQLRELARLSRLLYLCFDADKAGQEATLRGMELAVRNGFDVRVVTLPPGQDPADDPARFGQHLAGAESYLRYRVRLELERAPDRQVAFVRAREVLAGAEDSPERQEAIQLLQDRLDLPKQVAQGLTPARRGAPPRTGSEPRRVVDAARQLARSALAAAVAHPAVAARLAELSEDHFDDPAHRRFRSVLARGDEDDADMITLRAELDARAAHDAIDERTGTELVLRLRERKLRRDLAGADLARTTELQAHLAKIRQAIAELA
jgi:DNA primase